jgi:cell division protein FtsB
MTTYARGASFTRVARKVPVSLVTAWALVALLLIGGGFLVQHMAVEASAQAATVSAQSATIADQTATIGNMARSATDTNARIAVCLDDTAKYKAYSVENQATLRAIQAKWGVNYAAPVKDAYAMVQAGIDQLNCK